MGIGGWDLGTVRPSFISNAQPTPPSSTENSYTTEPLGNGSVAQHEVSYRVICTIKYVENWDYSQTISFIVT